MNFKDKVVIITGGGKGMGKEACLEFARLGAKVVVNSVNNPFDTVKEITQAGGQAIAMQGDVSNENDAKNLVDTAVKTYGRIDVLVNNAGVTNPGTIEELSVEQWDTAMATNLRSVFLMSKFAVGQFKKQGGGIIVNNASYVACKGAKSRACYVAAKGGVVALTREIAADYALENIRVNSFCPGPVATPALRGRIESAPDPVAMEQAFSSILPLKRIGEMSEIVAVMLFLAWEKNSFMTGANIIVDGGAINCNL